MDNKGKLTAILRVSLCIFCLAILQFPFPVYGVDTSKPTTVKTVSQVVYRREALVIVGTGGIKDPISGTANKYGIIDKTGRWVVEPVFDYLFDGDQSKLSISILDTPLVCALGKDEKGNGQYGYINKQGEWVINPSFDLVSPFKDGLAKVGYSTAANDFPQYRSGYINSDGEFVIPAQFDGLGDFKNGLCPVKKGNKWGFIDETGKFVIPAKFDLAVDGMGFEGGISQAGSGDKIGYIDLKGNWVIAPKYTHLRNFSDGLACASIGWRDKQRHGYIDIKGNWALKPVYSWVGDFHNGIAVAAPMGKSWYDKWRFGVINKKGQWVIKPKFDWVFGEFCEGKMPASLNENDKVGYINTKGNWVIKPQFEDAMDFAEGIAPAKYNGKWGLINSKGNWVVKPKFDDMFSISLWPKD